MDEPILKEQFEQFLEVLISELELSDEMTATDSKLTLIQLEQLKRQELNRIKTRLDLLDSPAKLQDGNISTFDSNYQLLSHRKQSDPFQDMAPSFRDKTHQLDLANMTTTDGPQITNLNQALGLDKSPFNSELRMQVISPGLIQKFDRVNELVGSMTQKASEK